MSKSDEPKYAILYARVSTERQAQKDLSIPDQLARMRDYCERNNLLILEEYVDEGKSATDDNRPAFQSMIHTVLHGDKRIHAIVVHSFSRAHRNVVDLGNYLKQISSVGTRLVSVTQDVDESPIGRFVMLFYGLVDEMNSAENSKHVKRAMQENARRGFFNGSTPPFGFQVNDTKVIGRDGYRKVLAINEKEAEIVREIYRLYDGVETGITLGMKRIVEHLNAKCLYRGRLWRTQQVAKILHDPVYIGQYEFGTRSLVAQHQIVARTEGRAYRCVDSGSAHSGPRVLRQN